MGNGEIKELIFTINGHELGGRNADGRGCGGQRGIRGRKEWDSYNSIINKIYLKIKIKTKNNQNCQKIELYGNLIIKGKKVNRGTISKSVFTSLSTQVN